jgi:SAM-dependent methyltransferase
MPPDPAPWWALLYDELLAELMFDGADPGEAAQTLALLRREGLLSLGARVFDQGCGNGRLALALLAEGAVFEGGRPHPRLHRRGAATGRSGGVGVKRTILGRRHRRKRCPAPPCDLAMSWWTCLGYAPTDAENLRPLQRAFEALRPGGTYAIDTMNVAQVLRAFLPQVERRLARPEGELRLLRESWIDLPAGVLHKRWRWSLPDGSARERLSAVRLYLPHEWARLLRRAGFDSLRFFGDLSGGPLTEDSSRCIIFAQRRT